MERPQIKDAKILAYIEPIEKRLDIFENSPYVQSYLAVYFQLVSFNQQLKIPEGYTKNIDLFADKEDKSFDRTKWYFENILELNKTLDELRKLMTPDQQKEISKQAINAKAGLAEQLALNGKH